MCKFCLWLHSCSVMMHLTGIANFKISLTADNLSYIRYRWYWWYFLTRKAQLVPCPYQNSCIIPDYKNWKEADNKLKKKVCFLLTCFFWHVLHCQLSFFLTVCTIILCLCYIQTYYTTMCCVPAFTKYPQTITYPLQFK